MTFCKGKLELEEPTNGHYDLILQCNLPPGHAGSHSCLVLWPQTWRNDGKEESDHTPSPAGEG